MVVKLKIFVAIVILSVALLLACSGKIEKVAQPASETAGHQDVIETELKASVITGAERVGQYLPEIRGRRIAMVVNHTSMIGSGHLVDSLLALEVELVKLFAPEHGFRGEADAGEKLADGKDSRTGLPLISLYGKKKKPSAGDLAGVDLVIFDIQDVGARFYTYIYTMTYVMEACAENEIPVLILDRPNPNGHYVDGPMLDPAYRSFIGLHEIPVVHGMTVGEYARMINEEGWLENGVKCDLKVIPCRNYDHQTFYELPVKPSPNLPNMRAIYLYPSICFFEGTVVSVGRGTDKQFQVIGAPDFKSGEYDFTPVSKPGAKNPKHEGVNCNGFDLTRLDMDKVKHRNSLNLSYLLDFYQAYPDKESFFLKNGFFDRLAGGEQLREQLVAGKTEAGIRQSWEPGLSKFRQLRKKYLLYDDFE